MPRPLRSANTVISIIIKHMLVAMVMINKSHIIETCGLFFVVLGQLTLLMGYMKSSQFPIELEEHLYTVQLVVQSVYAVNSVCEELNWCTN